MEATKPRNPRPHHPRIALTALLALLLAAVIPGPARAQWSCSLEQITFGRDANLPALSADGSKIAFTSLGDLVPGENPDGNLEVFLYDVAGGQLTQITHTTLGIEIQQPAISGDGRWVAFAANRELLPGPSFEIFLYDVASSSLVQRTQSLEGSHSPSLSATGSRMVYLSRGLTVVELPGGTPEELFPEAAQPALSGDGRWIVFTSIADLVPGQNPDGNHEVFLYDLATAALTQITHTAGAWGEATQLSPSIDHDGSRLALASKADLVPGGNFDGNAEIFLYEVGTAVFRQVTDTQELGHYSTALSGDGTTLAYSATPDGLDTQHLYLNDLANRATTTLAAAPGRWAQIPSVSSNGSRTAFSFNGELVPGSNPSRRFQVFLSTCRKTALWLNGGRFRVEADWELLQGDAGEGRPVKLTDDSGYFWFFHPDNIEVVVKILDGCDPFGYFWVFAAGLTNVEVVLRVTDTAADVTNVYRNPMGHRYEALQETQAFATCDVPFPATAD